MTNYLTAQRLALLAVGGRVDSLSKREKLKARKLPKNAARTHRQVHAVLGCKLINSIEASRQRNFLVILSLVNLRDNLAIL